MTIPIVLSPEHFIPERFSADNSIFITYKPDSELERTLAIRLHTIGAVSGWQMYLPNRSDGFAQLDRETQLRIGHSSWFILFSMSGLSPTVRHEIEYALTVMSDPSRIVIIYDSSGVGRNLTGADGCTEVFFDPRQQTFDEAARNIPGQLWRQSRIVAERRVLERELQLAQNRRNGLAALLGIGLGLFALSVLSEDSEEDPPAVTPRKRRKKSAGASGKSRK